MTLKEKFRQSLTGHLSDEKTEVDINIAEKIADDYAIEFVRWCFGNEHTKDYYIKALNEFKKEKFNECSECGGTGYIESSSILIGSYPCEECDYHKLQKNY